MSQLSQSLLLLHVFECVCDYNLKLFLMIQLMLISCSGELVSTSWSLGNLVSGPALRYN